VHASHEALTLHSPVAHPRSPSVTLLARCECLKRHGVGEREGELGADFDSETSAFTSQSKLSRISILSFLWCSFQVKTHRLDFSVLITVELAKAESKPRDLSKNGPPRKRTPRCLW
jgi:hypothetical protein